MTDMRITSPLPHATTLRDIAERCGVSIWTVSLALRHDPRISQATATRVLDAAQALAYDPAVHQAARRLVSRRLGQVVLNNVIGLLLPPSFQTANYFAYTSLGVLDRLASEGYGVLTTYATLTAMGSRPNLPSIYARGEVDGIIAMGSLLGEDAIYQLRSNPGFSGRPIVSLILPRRGCSCVMTDDRAGAYAATIHLLELGHRHIVHSCTTEYGPMSMARLEGACQAMRERGLDPEQYLHYFCDRFFGNLYPPHHLTLPDPTSEDEIQIKALAHLEEFADYLHAHPHYTAILAHNDPTARRIWYMLQQHGWHVPDDISLIGFDDTDGIQDEYGRNVLTSVRLPLREVGNEAAKLLIRQLTGKGQEEELVVLPTELMLRASTAPVKVKCEQ